MRQESRLLVLEDIGSGAGRAEASWLMELRAEVDGSGMRSSYMYEEV